ncbi:hypothetical protein M7I_7236 [Glarea lozoyensis 74030]|uniref:Guanine nucleotide-exchange factor SEC12 n=1 Tax=Glarea lozoyensis (strain ATCC 74030 / MF5533) TaxID=1104152 RepID=H0EWR3_GLAL7|nr:hypothetical protein M7I_7236 [Glarea lozoyensis 74030]
MDTLPPGGRWWRRSREERGRKQNRRLEEVGEIDLSKEEDNVTSLAVGGQGHKTIVFAGANSSPKDVKAGNNAHFRVFEIETAGQPSEKAKAAESGNLSHNKITETSRSILFKGADPDTYQRLLRLSKPFPNQVQLGAVATGLTKDPEIVLFDTSSTTPPKSRGAVRGGREAVDLDFLQTGDSEYQFAYCDIFDVFLKKITSTVSDEEPQTIYKTPASRSTERVTVPQFRALRWLTKDSLLMLTNIHSNGGAVLQLLRLPPSGKGECRVARSHRLPPRITKASALAVCNLTPPLSPSAPQDYTQFVIAVAAQDMSVSLFKLDLQAEVGVTLFSKIKPFRTFKDVHPYQITGLTFSNFEPPAHPVTARTPPQNLKLASVGVSNTVVVHTIPLFPVPLSVKRGQSKTPRYVVALPSSAVVVGLSVALITLGVLLASIFIQTILEIRGAVPNYINARHHIPLVIQEAIGKPYSFPEGYDGSSRASNQPVLSGRRGHLGQPTEETDPPLPGADIVSDPVRLAELLQNIQKNDGDDTAQKYFITEHGESPDGINAHLHDEAVHSGHSWEDLTQEQRVKWQQKLKDAGYWAEDMGETILKGIVFGTLGGMVGQAVGGG